MESQPGTTRPQETAPLDIGRCLAKAERVIEATRLSPDTFLDLYGADNIARDNATVKRMEQKFIENSTPQELEAKKLATCFEAFIVDQINHGLLGAHARSLPTSAFDDIVGGVDSIVEMDQPTRSVQHLGLAIDATYSTLKLDTKMRGIASRLGAGRLVPVRYFRSERTGHRGEYAVPLFVTGISKENMVPLLHTWTQTEGTVPGPHSLVLLKQIEAQAAVFRTLCHAHPQLAARFSDIEHAVAEIRQEKRRELSTPILPERWAKDRVSTEILAHTQKLARK